MGTAIQSENRKISVKYDCQKQFAIEKENIIFVKSKGRIRHFHASQIIAKIFAKLFSKG